MEVVHKIALVECYFLNQKNIQTAITEFRKKFPDECPLKNIDLERGLQNFLDTAVFEVDIAPSNYDDDLEIIDIFDNAIRFSNSSEDKFDPLAYETPPESYDDVPFMENADAKGKIPEREDSNDFPNDDGHSILIDDFTTNHVVFKPLLTSKHLLTPSPAKLAKKKKNTPEKQKKTLEKPKRTPEKQKKTPEKNKTKEEREAQRKIKENLKKFHQEKAKALRDIAKTNGAVNCHKAIKTFVSNDIFDFCEKEELENMFKEKEAPLYFIDDILLENGVKWTREEKNLIEDFSPEKGNSCINPSVTVNKKEISENTVLMILDSAKYIPLFVESSKMLKKDTPSMETMHDFVRYTIQEHEKNLTIVLVGLEKYLNSVKRRQNNEFLEQQGLTSKRKNDQSKELPIISKHDIDWVILDISVRSKEIAESDHQVHFVFVNSGSEVCKVIWSHTRALALAPVKESCQHGLDWYAQNDALGTVDMVGDAAVPELWIKQLMTLPKISEDLAKAIAKKYPTPRCLLNGYELCLNDEERADMLSNIEVSKNNYAHGMSTRRVGPQLSRKVFNLMTTRDPNLIID